MMKTLPHLAVLRNQAGAFTLKELLVAVVLVAILVAATFPAIQSMAQQSKQVKCLSNLRQIGVLTQQYVSENAQRIFPDARLLAGGMAENPNDAWGRWLGVMNEMLGLPTTLAGNPELRGPELSILICPADSTRGGWNHRGAQNGIPGNVPRRDGIKAHSYAPNRLLLNQRTAQIPQPSKSILFVDLEWERTGARSLYPHSQPWMSLLPRTRHAGSVNVLFLDGHVESVRVDDLHAGGRYQNAWFRDPENPELTYQ